MANGVGRMGNVFPLKNSENEIFFAKPKKIYASASGRTLYEISKTIEDLITDLREQGPLVGRGQLGPKNYLQEPQLEYMLHGQKIHEWKPGTVRPEAFVSSSVIILGAKKTEKKSYVYFTTSVSNYDNVEAIRIHKPDQRDEKIYAVSHAIFRIYTKDIVSPFPGTTEPVEEESLFVREEVSHPIADFPAFFPAFDLQASMRRRDSLQSESSYMSYSSIWGRRGSLPSELSDEIFD